MGRDYTNTWKTDTTGTAQSVQEMAVVRKNDGPITASSLLLPPRPVPPNLLIGMETYVSSGGNEALRVSGHSPLFSTESRN
jgi:hypothetical protein